MILEGKHKQPGEEIQLGPGWLVPVSVKKLAEECYCQTKNIFVYT